MDFQDVRKKIFEIIFETTDLGKKEKPEAIALFMLYYELSVKTQLGLVSQITIPEAAEILEISKDRVSKARKLLKDLQIIETFTKKEDGGFQHYIKIEEGEMI